VSLSPRRVGRVGSRRAPSTAVVFTVSHAAASYMNPVEAILFQIILLPMALLFAYLMHKSDNVWGSALYHAGSDVFLFYLMGW
jgi:membrane protease YdiL (CAAX protease family)